MGGEEIRAGLPVLSFEDSAAMEAWLERHGEAASGFWLRLFRKGSGVLSVSKAEAVDAALCRGWIDGLMNPYDDTSWLIRFTPRRPRSKWSVINRERAEALIAEGRGRPAGSGRKGAGEGGGPRGAGPPPPPPPR